MLTNKLQCNCDQEMSKYRQLYSQSTRVFLLQITATQNKCSNVDSCVSFPLHGLEFCIIHHAILFGRILILFSRCCCVVSNVTIIRFSHLIRTYTPTLLHLFQRSFFLTRVRSNWMRSGCVFRSFKCYILFGILLGFSIIPCNRKQTDY